MNYSDLCKEIAAHDGPIAVDIESTGLRPFKGDVLRGASVAFRRPSGELVSEYVSLTHPDSENHDPAPLAAALNAHAGLRVGWHMKFDSKFLEHIGVGWAENGVDAMHEHWLLDENRRHGLKPAAAAVWPEEDPAAEQRHMKALQKSETKADAYKRFRGAGYSVAESKALSETDRIVGKTWATFTAADLGDYAAKDAELTLRLHEHHQARPDYSEAAVRRHYQVEGVVFRMERVGVQVDLDQVDKTLHRYEGRMQEIIEEFDGTNLGSPAQLGRLLYDTWGLPVHARTESGQPATDKAALDLYPDHPGVAKILEYRHLQKAAASYFRNLIDMADDAGRVHPTFRTTGTATGRFSCTDPNLQQIPRDGTNSDVRDVFIAAPGLELWSFDMSQAELRLAASVASEEQMLQAFAEGRDIYQQTADELGITRQVAKTVMLASTYGVGPKKLAATLARQQKRLPTEADVRTARRVLDDFWRSLPRLAATMNKLTAYAEATGAVPLHEPGRFRRFPSPDECRRRGLTDWPKPYSALNAVLQGGCAEILKSWLLLVEDAVEPLGARLCLTVHDSLALELEPGTQAAVHAALQATLDSVVPAGWCRIPLEGKQGV